VADDKTAGVSAVRFGLTVSTLRASCSHAPGPGIRHVVATQPPYRDPGDDGDGDLRPGERHHIASHQDSRTRVFRVDQTDNPRRGARTPVSRWTTRLVIPTRTPSPTWKAARTTSRSTPRRDSPRPRTGFERNAHPPTPTLTIHSTLKTRSILGWAVSVSVLVSVSVSSRDDQPQNATIRGS
jgi:hypothetical protein